MFHTVHDELRDLSDDTHDDRNEKDCVLLEELFSIHTASIPQVRKRYEKVSFSEDRILL